MSTPKPNITTSSVPSTSTQVKPKDFGQAKLTVTIIGCKNLVFDGELLGGRFSDSEHMLNWILAHKSFMTAITELGCTVAIQRSDISFVDPHNPSNGIVPIPLYPGDTTTYILRIRMPDNDRPTGLLSLQSTQSTPYPPTPQYPSMFPQAYPRAQSYRFMVVKVLSVLFNSKASTA